MNLAQSSFYVAIGAAGIGLYAPCMITLAPLGMHPLAAFPIMMGACAPMLRSAARPVLLRA